MDWIRAHETGINPRCIDRTFEAETVFQMERIPTDTYIRNLLDLVRPSELSDEFRFLLRQMAESGYHVILLGDDLYSRQPLCQVAMSQGCDFIFVAHRDSHPALYAVVDEVANLGRMTTFSHHYWNGQHGEIWTYRFLNDVPLRAGDDALLVNWCDLSIIHEETEISLLRNEWIISLMLQAENILEVVACGRARWKSKNENNNVLKNHGYHIDHNFGHGQERLALLC